MESKSYVVHICAANFIVISNVFATISMFNASVFFLFRRTRYINLLLSQLLFNEKLSDEYFFLQINYDVLSRELNRTHQLQTPTPDGGLTSKFWLRMRRRQSNETSATAKKSTKSSSILHRKIWPTNRRIDGIILSPYDSNAESFELDKLMLSYTFSDMDKLKHM